MHLKSDSGNAVIEFIAFGVMLFLPLASFAASTSNGWVAKQEAQNVATQLARAYTINQGTYLDILDRFRATYVGLEVSETVTGCCVDVEAVRDGQRGLARQVL